MARERCGDENDADGRVSLGRRSYVAYAGLAAIGAVGAATGTAAADGTVDIVEEGADDTGSTAINGVLESVHGTGETIYFPPGEYLLEPFSTGASDWTWIGEDATFVVPNSVTGSYLRLSGDNWTVEGIDVDLSAPDAAPTNRFRGNDWVVRDLEFVGQMGDPGERGGSSLLYMDVADAGRSGLLENVRAMDGSADVGESSNRGGLRIVGSEGDITLRNVAVSGFANNSMYFHNMPGHLRLEGCLLRDTNTGLRIGGNTTVVDTVFDQSNAPAARWSGAAAARGIWINSNSSTSGDVVIEGCEFRMGDPRGANAVYSSNGLDGIEIRDCRIEQNANSIAIQLDSGGSGRTEIENVSIVGELSRPAIYLSGRSGARLRNLCLATAGDGIRLRNSSDVSVTESTIDVGGTAIDGQASTSGISESGSCPAPTLERDGGTDDAGDDEDEPTDEDSDDEDESADEPDGTPIRLEGTAEYVIEVSGEIEPAPEIARWVEEGEQYGDGRADWYLTDSWTEWYFTGELEAVEFENEADLTVYVDGEAVDPQTLPPTDDDPERRLRMEGAADYVIEAGEGIRPAESIARWVDEGEQYGDGRADWYLTGSWTEWLLSGGLEALTLEVDDQLEVTVEPGSGGSAGDERRLRMEGTGEYVIEASGSIRPAESISRWVEEGEQYGDGRADWYLTGSWTEWVFTGELERLEIAEAADLTVELE